ncbi:MAG TPA: hypothetical protein VI298_11675 [Geobacteraceae bacterium]
MKKMLPVVAAALGAVFFATFVCAAEPVKKDAGPAPAAPAAGEVKKEETKPARKKGRKAKPVRKKGEEKKESAPDATEKK